jgi:Gpi18-like mannosyltransferase
MRRLREIAGNHRWQFAAFCLFNAIVLPLLFNTVYKTPYSTIGVYFDTSSSVLKGSLPYRDFTLEYPPFALFFFILPRLFTSNFHVYAVLFDMEIFLSDLVGLYLVYRIARYAGEAPWKMLAIYSAGILAMGPIVAELYDIFPAIMVLLSLYCFWIGRHKTAWFVLSVGVVTKIYPAAIAPVFLFYYVRNRQYRRIWSGLLVFAATGLALMVPFIATTPGGLLSFINYHVQRGTQIESTYGAFLLFAGKLGSTLAHLAFGNGAWNVTGPLADTLAAVSPFITLLFLLMSYWLIFRRLEPGKSRISELGTHSLLVIAVILFTSKVLSPQYLIWLFPLLPVLAGRQRYAIWAVFIVIGALTYYVFPLHYVGLIYHNTGPIIVLLVRDMLVIALAVLAAISLYRLKTGHRSALAQVNGD